MTAIKAVRVDDIESEAGQTPGAIEYRLGYRSDAVAGMGFRCPCGCGREGWLPFKPEPSPSWEWNGDQEAPTLRPSILQVGGCRWHGWLTAGEWRAC